MTASTGEVDQRTAALGALQCDWARDEPDATGHYPAVQLTTFPLDVIDTDTQAKYSSPLCEQDYDVALCKVGVSANGQWMLVVSGAVSYSMTDPIPLYLEPAAEAAAASAERFAPPRPFEPGVPAAPLDCGLLGERIDVAELVGATAQAGFPTGGVNSTTPARIAISSGVYQWCAWTVYDVPGSLPYVWYDVYPFAGWMWDEFANTDRGPVEAVTVDGATQAVQRTGLAQGAWLAATDGTIVVTVSGDAVDVNDAAARMLAALAVDAG
ncbi:hypothetical protein [Microbacterium sp.]|uniref:hypothetical protein n=1 Tax=Microbacterium sp. TaxID=51671 RepID=UPI0037C8BF03